MDILAMTDLEVYELGTKKLTEQMGPTYKDRCPLAPAEQYVYRKSIVNGLHSSGVLYT